MWSVKNLPLVMMSDKVYLHNRDRFNKTGKFSNLPILLNHVQLLIRG